MDNKGRPIREVYLPHHSTSQSPQILPNTNPLPRPVQSLTEQGGVATKAKSVCLLVRPGVRTGLGVQGEIVNVVWSQTVGKPQFFGGAGGRCRSAHRRCFCPSRGSADNASREIFPKAVTFGGCSPPHLMWKCMEPGGSGSPNATHRWCTAFSGILPFRGQSGWLGNMVCGQWAFLWGRGRGAAHQYSSG